MSQLFSILDAGEADPQLLERVRKVLQIQSEFVLWLQGEMGAGKTSFVRAYLYELGLPSHTPVVSPTYTLMNEYKIGEDWYAHLDLYRADARFSLDELGVRDVRRYRGIFIEWPEQAGASETLGASHILQIKMNEMNRRSYTLIET